MTITMLSSNEQVLSELGSRVRVTRIATPLTQEELAERAGVSLSMVARFERGQDVRLGNVLSILRALGLLANVDALVPQATVRPLDLAQLGHQRQRAASSSRREANTRAWKWGDEQ